MPGATRRFGVHVRRTNHIGRTSAPRTLRPAGRTTRQYGLAREKLEVATGVIPGMEVSKIAGRMASRCAGALPHASPGRRPACRPPPLRPNEETLAGHRTADRAGGHFSQRVARDHERRCPADAHQCCRRDRALRDLPRPGRYARRPSVSGPGSRGRSAAGDPCGVEVAPVRSSCRPAPPPLMRSP